MTVFVRIGAWGVGLLLCASACATRELAADGGETGPRTLHEPCDGRAGTRGSCAEGEICGSLPEVGYDYCLPAPPCPPDMVSVIDLACAYPCSEADDCAPYGFTRCSPNDLGAQIGRGPAGWCTP